MIRRKPMMGMLYSTQIKLNDRVVFKKMDRKLII